MSTKRTKVFLDTEFTELNQKAQLISIALVAETGQRFYAELSVRPCVSLEQMKFLSDNVIPQLASPILNTYKYMNPIRMEVKTFDTDNPTNIFDVGNDVFISPKRSDMYYFQCLAIIQNSMEKWFDKHFKNGVEIWCDVGAWDWILFCEIFGGARQIPSNVYYIPFDITTWMRMRGMDPDCDRVALLGKPADYPRHNALFDAMLLKELYEYMEAKG